MVQRDNQAPVYEGSQMAIHLDAAIRRRDECLKSAPMGALLDLVAWSGSGQKLLVMWAE